MYAVSFFLFGQLVQKHEFVRWKYYCNYVGVCFISR